MHRNVIRHFAHNHLRQQTCSGTALGDRLRRLTRHAHRALTGVFLACIFDYHHLRRNVLVALAHFFANMPQLFLTATTALFLFRQVVHDAFPFQMIGETPPSARFTFPYIGARRGRFIVGIIVGRGRICYARFLGKQSQLIGAPLFAARAALGRQQLAQQALCLVQLRGHIDEHLLENLGIVR